MPSMTTTSTTNDTCRIYVASLSDYNGGRLHGIWVDLDQDIDAITEQIDAMLDASPEAKSFPLGGPAEEWAIHDYDGPLAHIGGLGEYESLEKLKDLADAIDQHGAPFIAWFNYDDNEIENFEEAYRGEWSSEADYAQNFAEDCGYLTGNESWPHTYIDWNRAADEIFRHGSLVSVPVGDGNVYVFDGDI